MVKQSKVMCGIFGVVSYDARFLHSTKCNDAAQSIRHRGPDCSRTAIIGEESTDVAPKVRFDFHRLAINGSLDEVNMQPFQLSPHISVMVNGEIYNHRQIEENYNVTTRGSSDCEIVAQLMSLDIPFRNIVAALDGVFAIAAFDARSGTFYAARDPMGVRSLFIGTTTNATGGARFGVASELKALAEVGLVHLAPFPPGKVIAYDVVQDKEAWDLFHLPFKPEYFPYVEVMEEQAATFLRDALTRAVEKRMMIDRLPVGCFLSGGLDSSIVTSLVVRCVVEQGGSPSDVHTFSIGQEGATDLSFARDVASFLGTTHHVCNVTMDQMLDQIPQTIVDLETWDTTSVRAGTGHAMLCSFVRDNTDVKVLFSGEGADELFLSYRYGQMAPSDDAFQSESMRLVTDLHRYDNLRVELACASRGLECRVPFLDKDFVNVVFRTPPSQRGWREGMEKFLLRKAFSKDGYLPQNVCWRRKEAFSDGVSTVESSWHSQIKARASQMFPNAKGDAADTTAESLWYQSVFEDRFPGCRAIIPYIWLPRWCGEELDPSARALQNYASNGATMN